MHIRHGSPWHNLGVRGKHCLLKVATFFFPSHQGLQVNSLPIFLQSLHCLVRDWNIRKVLHQIFRGFPWVGVMGIFSFQIPATIKVAVFSDVITLIHHPGSKAFDDIYDKSVSDIRNPAAPATHQSAACHQFRTDTGGLLLWTSPSFGVSWQSSFARRRSDLDQLGMWPPQAFMF